MESSTNTNARSAPPPVEWSRFKFPQSAIHFGLLLFLLCFIVYMIHYLNIPLERFLTMFGRLGELVSERYFPPDIDYIWNKNYLDSVIDTIKMSYLGMLFGMLIAFFLAWFGSFNMTPNKYILYPLARLVTMLCRSVHETIWTIIFVTIIGFGMLPGVMALIMFCIGFAGKLLAEEIESINPGPVEAIRAAGGNQVQVMAYGVWPQIKVAFTGIAIYTWDVAFRAATVVGFFGAGGMGWYLKQSIYQIESNRTGAILFSIIFLVIIAEILSAWGRARVARSR